MPVRLGPFLTRFEGGFTEIKKSAEVGEDSTGSESFRGWMWESPARDAVPLGEGPWACPEMFWG